MKHYLLPESGSFYKANLHAHSAKSDGRFTPEELKAAFKEKGYSILALTDHDALYSHNEMTEDDFLMLTAYEISLRSDDDPTPHAFRKVVDLCLYAKDKNNLTHIAYHPETVQWLVEQGKMTQEQKKNIKYAGELKDCHYYPANVNQAIKSANENGFLVSVNHLSWGNVNYSDYGLYEGMWAVEIFNYGCHILSGLYDNEHAFDEYLKSGKKVFAVATDDSHSFADAFGGFTMIKAEELKYEAVIDAMEKGNFYSSMGPEIKELYYEDGFVHIKTSPVKHIILLTLGRRGVLIKNPDGSLLTEASFKIDPENYGLVRFKIRDTEGNLAWTNAYNVDEFMPDADKRRAIL